MSGLTLSKITSSLMLFGPKDSKVNAGLNLKFDAKNQKVLGYSRKTDNGWEFSEKAIELISNYQVSSASRSARADDGSPAFLGCIPRTRRRFELFKWQAR